MNLSNIYEGWRNKLFPPEHLKEIIKYTSDQRMSICKECPYHSTNARQKGYKSMRIDEHCTSCGRTLSAKTSCLSCECPFKKWLPLMTEKQEEEIENETK